MCSDFHMDGEWICIVLHAAEETGTNQSKENESRSERWTSRRRLSDLLFRSELDYNDVALDMQGSDRDDVDYFDNDMEMEVEMSAGEDGERDREDGGWSGSVRLRSRGDMGEQESVRGGSSGISMNGSADIQVNQVLLALLFNIWVSRLVATLYVTTLDLSYTFNQGECKAIIKVHLVLLSSS
jgi:hypothetical protein